METYNYNAIISEMVADLKERVAEGYDVHDAAIEIADGSQYAIYTRHHYKILDMCRVDPADVVSEYGIDYGSDFNLAIARTVTLCLYLDMIDEYHDNVIDEDD